MADRAPRPNLGAALEDAWRAEGVRQRARPPAVSTRAKLVELTRSRRGQAALVAAGAAPGRSNRNWIAWLSGERAPSAANARAIADAYGRWFGPGFPDVANRTHAIHGRVAIGADVRDRGDPHNPRARAHAPLRVDGSTGRWDRIREAWNARRGPGVLGVLFVVDVIGPTLEISAASLPTFDGDAYLVVLE